MLLDRLMKATNALRQRQVADQSQSVVGWHARAKAVLAEGGNQLRGVSEAATVLREAGILKGPLPDRPFAALRKEIATAEAGIRQAGDSKPDEALSALLNRLTPCRERAEQHLRESWLAYLERNGAVAVSEDMVARLRALGLDQVAAALGQATNVLRSAKAGLPRTRREIEAVQQASAAVERAWSQASITLTMVPQVIALSSDQGLQLSGASKEVLRWLEEKRLDTAVRLRFR